MERLSYLITRHCTLQNTLVAVLVLTLAVFMGVLFFESFETKVSEHLGVSEKSEILKFVGIAMGGILIALQAHASSRRAKAMEDRTVSAEQGLLQERMKNAIEHLGHVSESVRLGGAYELFHLAKDARPQEDDGALQQTVLDILCAHIRRTTGDEAYRREHDSKPSEEIQSLLTLLFVQSHDVFRGCVINLQECWLNGADLRNARLSSANLIRARFRMAKLQRAQLQNCRLFEAHLQEALLSDAWLHESDLSNVNLAGADLTRARLQCANLDSARLQAACLAQACLQGAILKYANLNAGILSNVCLEGADVSHLFSIGASLRYANLRGSGTHSWNSTSSFTDRIFMSVGKETDLSRVWFSGIEQGAVDAQTKGLSDGKTTAIRDTLRPYIGMPPSHELPEESGAITGSYSEEEAEKWIAEYEEAMSGITEEDS